MVTYSELKGFDEVFDFSQETKYYCKIILENEEIHKKSSQKTYLHYYFTSYVCLVAFETNFTSMKDDSNKIY